MMQAGQMISGMGQNREMLAHQLAQFGPPPAVPQAMPTATGVGQNLVGRYQASMAPPSASYRTRQDVQMNPSVGQLLAGR